MLDIREAIKTICESMSEDERPKIIRIDTCVIFPDYLLETFSSGDKNDIYDDHIIEEWYSFAMSVENVVESLCDIVSISTNDNPHSLSEYIEFYIEDENGKRKDYLIDMRLSDHSSAGITNGLIKKKAEEIYSPVEFTSITTNQKATEFTSYGEVVRYIRKYI